MCENSTNFIAEKLIQQIDNKQNNADSTFWLLSAINRLLLVKPNMSLGDFRDLIDKQWPDTSSAFYSCLVDKNELKKAESGPGICKSKTLVEPISS